MLKIIGSILKILLFALLSWFLVHVLAVFGFFLAVTYPFWWLWGWGRVYCFSCQIKKTTKEECIFSHSLVTGGLVFLFTLISIGLVYLETQLLFKLGFSPTPKTAVFVIPPKGQHRIGEIFPMKIEIVGLKRPINAVQADLSFPPEILEVVEVSTQESFANLFVQKEINNQIGFTRLTGGLPNPGYFSDRGIFGTVYFKGKNPGIAKVEFLPSSLVLANDGQATNILKELASASYLILPERLTPEEEKQQEVLLQPIVLGEKVSEGSVEEEKVKMNFYDEKKVLGTEISQELKNKNKFNFGRSLVNLLGKIDQFILSFLGKIFFTLQGRKISD